MTLSLPLILNIQTTTFSAYGGIPTYNRMVCRVLNEISFGEKNYVLIATDKESHIEQPARELSSLRLRVFDNNRISLSREVFRLGLTRRVDLLLLGHVNYAPLGWLLKKLRPKLRYGVMLYGIDAWERLPRLKRLALQRADFLVSISEYTKRRTVEANDLVADTVYLLPNALEITSGDAAAKELQNPMLTEMRLLSVCRLDETERYKGVDKVIEVLPALATRVPNIQYFVVGGGTDVERHKQLAKQHGVAERVHFLGVVNDETLQDCYRDCDVFVMPSAGEGFGFVFLEAMKFGKAIVAARSGGAPEVIEDGVTGRLIEYGNADDLTQALLDLLLDFDQRARLGSAGFERLQERFTYDHFSRRLREILAAELPLSTSSIQTPTASQGAPESF